MTAKKKNGRKLSRSAKLRVSQGHVAKVAIQNIENLFKKLDLGPKRGKRTKFALRGTAHVPVALIEEVAAAADQHGSLIGLAFDSDAAREALAFAAAFEPVATKAEAFAQRVRDAVLAAKAEAGANALAAYASMKGVIRTEAGAPLRDSFDKMTQIMKRRRKRAAKTDGAAQAPPPATPPPSPPATPASTSSANADKPVAGSTTIVVNPPEPAK